MNTADNEADPQSPLGETPGSDGAKDRQRSRDRDRSDGGENRKSTEGYATNQQEKRAPDVGAGRESDQNQPGSSGRNPRERNTGGQPPRGQNRPPQNPREASRQEPSRRNNQHAQGQPVNARQGSQRKPDEAQRSQSRQSNQAGQKVLQRNKGKATVSTPRQDKRVNGGESGAGQGRRNNKNESVNEYNKRHKGEKIIEKIAGPDTVRRHPSKLSRIFDHFANKVTKVTGSPWAFIVAFIVIIVWAISGPIFGFSDTWQLVINTGTTIITFLMVFVIQQSQNKDTLALQMKLNELIASNKEASNRLIDIEDLTEEELIIIKDYYIKLSAISKKEKELQRSHSIEDLETGEIEECSEDYVQKGAEAKKQQMGSGRQSQNK
ncbi:MAG TPA: low affinity iron permease family protein [Arachidicoccus sp.]|nr:low affinity iron permease family protein [Arachidicoccus sp.]